MNLHVAHITPNGSLIPEDPTGATRSFEVIQESGGQNRLKTLIHKVVQNIGGRLQAHQQRSRGYGPDE